MANYKAETTLPACRDAETYMRFVNAADGMFRGFPGRKVYHGGIIMWKKLILGIRNSYLVLLSIGEGKNFGWVLTHLGFSTFS